MPVSTGSYRRTRAAIAIPVGLQRACQEGQRCWRSGLKRVVTLRAICSRWVSQVPQHPPQMSMWVLLGDGSHALAEVHGIAGLEVAERAQ